MQYFMEIITYKRGFVKRGNAKNKKPKASCFLFYALERVFYLLLRSEGDDGILLCGFGRRDES